MPFFISGSDYPLTDACVSLSTPSCHLCHKGGTQGTSVAHCPFTTLNIHRQLTYTCSGYLFTSANLSVHFLLYINETMAAQAKSKINELASREAGATTVALVILILVMDPSLESLTFP